jgi:hypothetical protein
MKKLTEIEEKIKQETKLNKEDLVFIYEIDSSIQYFGMTKDPRIDKIRKERIPKEDAPIVLDCEPNQIATNLNEVNENTKAYIGPWNMEIFQTIKNYPNIENLYESFPDKKIFLKNLETDPKINSVEMAEKELANNNMYLSDWGKDILYKTEFSQEKKEYNLVRFTVKQLGFPSGATTEQIYQRAEDLGLELCPAEVGPHLRLQTSSKDLMFVAMKQITDRSGYPGVFLLDWNGVQLELDGSYAEPAKQWYGYGEFVFRFRKLET